VGTSSIVYPAAAFAPMLALRGVPVAEFNLESTPVTNKLKCVDVNIIINVCHCNNLRFHFQGKCGELLPKAVEKHDTEP